MFMSGFADSTLARHDAISGDIDCVLKPFTPEDLARKVRETLDGVAVS
jgi:FixJ family two-component response regulator